MIYNAGESTPRGREDPVDAPELRLLLFHVQLQELLERMEAAAHAEDLNKHGERVCDQNTLK